MAAAGPSVVRLLATPEFTGVEGIDAETETVSWRLATTWSSAGIHGGATGVYFVTDPNLLVAVDPVTGVDLWQRSFGGPIVSMTLQDADLNDDVLYVWDESSAMTAIDTATGDPLWETTTADPGGPQRDPSGPGIPGVTPAIGENVVVMVAANGTLNAFDRSSGEIVWSTPGFDGVQSRIAIELDRLLVLSSSPDAAEGVPNLIGTGMDLATGTVDWRIGIGGSLEQPAASEDTFFYVIANTIVTYPDGEEIAPEIVDYAECCTAWTVSGNVRASAGSGVDSGTDIFGIDTATGKPIWSRSTESGAFITAKTIFPQSGGLFAVTSDGQLIWLQRETGGILPEPMDLGGQVVEFIPFSVDTVRYVATMTDGSLMTIRRTQPPG
jgi:outer membrane protein assembly factor BamB